jgi:GMP synthase-like glutamine amidotransferase
MTALQPVPRVLVVDNEPRHGLSRRWFGKWLVERLGCRMSAPHVIGGSRVKSLDSFDALVISGSPESARQEDAWVHHNLELVAEAARLGMPILGVCFGAQLLARAYYGKGAIRRSPQPEIGWHPIEHQTDDPLFEGIPRRFVTFQWHEEEVILQPGMQLLAHNETTRVQAFRLRQKPVWGLQFHPEITPHIGRDLLRRDRADYEPLGITYEELASQAQPNQATEQLFRNFVRASRVR